MPGVPNFTAKAWGVDAILGGKLEEFVTTRRAEGRAWRHIATDLFEATDRKVDVTSETLRQWFPEDREPEAAAS